MPAPSNTQGPAHPPVAELSRTLLLATDLQQSILAELDRSGPNRLAYTAYGSQSGQRTAGSHLGFNGQLRERPTGWYHLGNGYRVYNPALMRFHSPDRLSPFGKGGVNAYVYCGGDPVNFADPTGEYGAAIATIIQRGLTVALHTAIPAGILLGPKATGPALIGVRVSLAGSATSTVGTLMLLSGIPAGNYVANAGLTGSVIGLFTRVAASAHTAYKKGVLWKTFRDNVRNVLGMSSSAPPVIPTSTAIPDPIPLAPISTPDSVFLSPGQFHSSSSSPPLEIKSNKIRQS